MKGLIVLTLITTLFSCSPTSKDLKDNKTIKTVFDKGEINDLEIILTFFENQICKNGNISNENVLECYESFFKGMSENADKNIIEIEIPFENQIELYKQIDSATFNQLWSFGRLREYKSPDTLKHISFRRSGKYVKFLGLFGTENEVIKDYYDAFIGSGDISPSMVARVLKMYNDYDTRDIRIRLLISVHYLTLNDQQKRREKY